MLHLFKKYSPKHDKYVTLNNNLVKKLLKGFKNEIFPLYYDKEDEEQMEFEKGEEEEEEENI